MENKTAMMRKSAFYIFSLVIYLIPISIQGQELLVSEEIKGEHLKYAENPPKILHADEAFVTICITNHILHKRGQYDLKLVKLERGSMKIVSSVDLKYKDDKSFYQYLAFYHEKNIYVFGIGSGNQRGEGTIEYKRYSENLELEGGKVKIASFRSDFPEPNKLSVHQSDSSTYLMYDSKNYADVFKLINNQKIIRLEAVDFSSFDKSNGSLSSWYSEWKNEFVLGENRVCFMYHPQTVRIHDGIESKSKPIDHLNYYYLTSPASESPENGSKPIMYDFMNYRNHFYSFKKTGFYSIEIANLRTGEVQTKYLKYIEAEFQCNTDVNNVDHWKKTIDYSEDCNQEYQNSKLFNTGNSTYTITTPNKLIGDDTGKSMELVVSKFNDSFKKVYSKVVKVDLSNLISTLKNDSFYSQWNDNPYFYKFSAVGAQEDHLGNVTILLSNKISYRHLYYKKGDKIKRERRLIYPLEDKRNSPLSTLRHVQYEYDFIALTLDTNGVLLQESYIDHKRYVPFEKEPRSKPFVGGTKLINLEDGFMLVTNNYKEGGISCIKLNKSLKEVERKTLEFKDLSINLRDAVYENGSIFAFGYEKSAFSDSKTSLKFVKENKIHPRLVEVKLF